jgi:hypothetical protein
MLRIISSDTHPLKAGLGTTVRCFHIAHDPETGEHPFVTLRDLCQNTPCNLLGHDVTECLPRSELDVIHPNRFNGKHRILMSKTADGMLFHIKDSLISGVHGKSFYDMHCADPIKVFTLNSHDTAAHAPFRIVFHDGPCEPHELSRHAITEHILHQLLALKPPCPLGNPHILFKSPNLGTFSTRVLKGPPVHELKLSFLDLVQQMAQTKGGSVYDRTIRLKPEFSQLLMLKHTVGHIRCDRCVDGIVGYRVRPHTQKKTFLFVANSNDFHAHAPVHPSQSMLQVMKLDYADPSKKGLRVVVRNHDAQDEPAADYEDVPQDEYDALDLQDAHEDDETSGRNICLTMTVQQIINKLEHIFRSTHLEHHNCLLFPLYCKAQAEKQRAYTCGAGYDDDDYPQHERALARLTIKGG